MKRALAALENRPWVASVLAAAGVTTFAGGAFALIAPADVLDAAVALGDRRLWSAVGALFVFAAAAARLALLRRRSQEDEVAAHAAVESAAGTHLR